MCWSVKRQQMVALLFGFPQHTFVSSQWMGAMNQGPGQPPLWQLWLSREPVSIPRRVKSEVPSMQLAGWCIKLVCFLLPSTSFLWSPQLRTVSYLLLESQEVIMKAATQRMLWVTWGFQGGLSPSPLVPHHAAYLTPRISL